MRLNHLPLLAMTALAFTGAGVAGAAAQGADERSGWSFQIGLYAWAPTFDGTFNYPLPAGSGGTASVRSDADSYLRDLNVAAMVNAEIRYERFSAITDLMYVDLGSSTSRVESVDLAALPSNPVSSTLNLSGDSSLQATIWTLAGGYTVAEGSWGNVDVLGGFRLLALDARTTYSLSVDIAGPRGDGVALARNGRLSGGDSIWNGVVGVRGRLLIAGSGFFVPYYADIGAGDSNLTWQAFSGVGYQTGWAGVQLGYRYMSFDQGSGSLVEKLSMGGAYLAVNFTF